MAGRFLRPARMGRIFGSPPQTAPSPSRGGQDGRAVFSALPAWAAEVVSSNIVGYTKVSLAEGYNIVGAQFGNVGTGGMPVSSVQGDNFQSGDQLRLWDADSNEYTSFAYYDVDNDGGVYADDTYKVNLGAGWGDDDQIAVNQQIDPGTGFWIENSEALVVTLLGEVKDVSTLEFSAGYNLLINPRPTQIDVSKITSTELESGDQIRFWDSVNNEYTSYAFYDVDNDGGVYEDDTYKVNLGAGWGDDDQVVPSATVGIGEGFWLETANSGTLTFGE